MVDLFSMFRRRPAKSGRGFARQDITALDDSVGGLVTSPVRDAPPIARDQQIRSADQFQSDYQVEPPRAVHPVRAAAKQNGSAGPQLLKRPGFLAVHSVEKSYGS